MVALLAAVVAGAQQISRVVCTNYLSVQHPEWPPLPAPPDEKMEVYMLAPGMAIMDDFDFKYPQMPEFTTIPPTRIDPASNFRFNTNFLQTHPEWMDTTKAMLKPTTNETTSRFSQLLAYRRYSRICAEIDRVVASARTNPPAVTHPLDQTATTTEEIIFKDGILVSHPVQPKASKP